MNTPGIIDLSPEDFRIVSDILRSHIPDRPVFFFGSRVTGLARRRSDLDLAVGGEKPLSLELYADLREAFSTSDLPIMVDIVDLAHTTNLFRKRIESEWLPLAMAAEQIGQKATA